MASEFCLGNHFEAFVQEQLATGRYSDASDVLRQALQLLESRERHGDVLVTLRQAWTDGMASGDAGVLDLASIKQEGRAALTPYPA